MKLKKVHEIKYKLMIVFLFIVFVNIISAFAYLYLLNSVLKNVSTIETTLIESSSLRQSIETSSRRLMMNSSKLMYITDQAQLQEIANGLFDKSEELINLIRTMAKWTKDQNLSDDIIFSTNQLSRGFDEVNQIVIGEQEVNEKYNDSFQKFFENRNKIIEYFHEQLNKSTLGLSSGKEDVSSQAILIQLKKIEEGFNFLNKIDDLIENLAYLKASKNVEDLDVEFKIFQDKLAVLNEESELSDVLELKQNVFKYFESLLKIKREQLLQQTKVYKILNSNEEILENISTDLTSLNALLKKDVDHDFQYLRKQVIIARFILLIGIFAVLVTVALVVKLYIHPQIIEKIKNLCDVASNFSEGNFAARVKIDSKDELGQLGIAFNNMADSLESYSRGLEEKIKQRTQELQLSLTQLQATQADLEAARSEAVGATQAKSEFLANMSHELRTPLNAIIGYSELLAETCEENGLRELTADLKKIHGAGRHLLSLINDILDLSKIEAGKMTIYLEDVSLKSLIHDIASLVKPLVEKKNNQFKTVLPPNFDSITMYTDAIKIRQNLLNLVSNASKFTENGTITLEIDCFSKDGNPWIKFAISDTGIGISPEKQLKLFKSFSQVDSLTTRKYGGTGLGLFLTERFCSLLGGTVSVTSKEGVGSTFSMLLPLKSSIPTEVGVAIKQKPDTAQPQLKSEAYKPMVSSTNILLPTVLIIDDDANFHNFIDKSIGQLFTFLHAYTARDGLSQAKKYKPDVITLDIGMPEIDGWDVLNELKSDPDLQNIPLIIITMNSEKNLGYILRVSDFLVKPCDPKVLLETLSKYLVGKPGYVLVVDDDIATREYLQHLLTKEGWRVALAIDGIDALGSLNHTLPSIILLDLMMPRMDGFQVIEALQANRVWSEIPVIIITSKDLTPVEKYKLNGNVQLILKKGGYNKKELLDEIQKLILESIRKK